MYFCDHQSPHCRIMHVCSIKVKRNGIFCAKSIVIDYYFGKRK